PTSDVDRGGSAGMPDHLREGGGTVNVCSDVGSGGCHACEKSGPTRGAASDGSAGPVPAAARMSERSSNSEGTKEDDAASAGASRGASGADSSTGDGNALGGTLAAASSRARNALSYDCFDSGTKSVSRAVEISLNNRSTRSAGPVRSYDRK